MKMATRMRLATLGILFAASTSFAATIIHSNDILGEIEPCGCRSNPLGGMARKENAVRKLSQKDPSLLQLDGGDLFFPSDSMPDLLAKQSELQAKHVVKALNLLKHDAVVPGEKDFALGIAAFVELKKEAQFKILAANLKQKKGPRLFDDHAIFERKQTNGKTIRIGVFGLVGDQLPWPSELKVSSAIAAAKKEVQFLKSKADLIVALTHQGYEKDLELAKKVPGIDLVIGGHTQSFLQNPAREGKTWVYQSSFKNQYLGIIPIEKPFASEKYQMIALDAGYDSAAGSPNSIDTLVSELKSSLGVLNSQQEAAIAKAKIPDYVDEEEAPVLGPRFHTFPRCAECHLKQLDFWRKTPHVRALQVLIDKKQSMNKECLSCHTVGLGDSRGFLDVNRLGEYHPQIAKPTSSPPSSNEAPEPPSEGGTEELNKPRSFSHEELGLFLKSMQAASSLKSEVKLTPSEPPMSLRRAVASMSRSWAPVQCENCHQAGENHPFSGNYPKKVETTVCLKCHTAERAPEWYTPLGQPDLKKIETKRSKVACPAGEMTPDED